jgi:phenylacetate-coenzyme A ligase PaaK-like adenylate-forming protein/ADP-heptose:LPS heptosyltransferase
MSVHPFLSRLAELEWPALPKQHGADLLALLYQLERSERGDAQQLRALQLQQMRHVLQHAVTTVPYYRDRQEAYESMLSATEAATETAWRRLPLLTRRDLQAAGDTLHSTALPPTHGRLTEFQTSGSTGQPVRVRGTGVTALFWEAITLRDHYWHKRDCSATLASLRVTSLTAAQPPDGLRMKDWGAPFSALHATGPSSLLSLATDIGTQARWLLRQEPQYLLSYPSNLAALARYFHREKLTLPDLCQLRTVGETLTEDVREACREAWGEVPLVDVYSSQEVGYIALQCPEGRYHAQAESLLVEVLDEHGSPCGPGQVGRVVVSSLHNFAMPLIRYELRDYAEVGSNCPCGRTLPVFTRILGRRRNMLTLPSGEQRWPLTGFHAYRDIAPIGQFQFVQRTTEDIEVRLVAERPLTAGEESRLADVIRQALGHPFRLNFVYYDGEIPRTAGGKFEEFVALWPGSDVESSLDRTPQKAEPGGTTEEHAGRKTGTPTMKQVLILNITRMGDLVQSIPLLARLDQEWPGVAIDLVIDSRFASMAGLLPGLRQVLSYDFRESLNKNHAEAHGRGVLSPQLAEWIQPLTTVGYDRVINLSFSHWSGVLAEAIGVSDTRGVCVGRNGVAVLRNPWLTHVVDQQQTRRLNRFNLVDLYALGGSGPGSFRPIRLSISSDAEEWAVQRLRHIESNRIPIAVQIGASKARKAWRPEYFGRTMAALSREHNVSFVLNSPKNEVDSVQQAVRAYQQAGGVNHACDVIENADVPQLAAVLRRCRLLLTNDTGPMHLAVGVGTPVIDLSVGHVDFHETGPYGPGHWVIQPLLDCAPCGYTQLCTHHVCKDQLIPDQVAALALYVLELRTFPEFWTGVRVFESGVDEDGLACYQQRAGQADSVVDWYATFWRRYWYQEWTGQSSNMVNNHPAPDMTDTHECLNRLTPSIGSLRARAEQFAKACDDSSTTASDLKVLQSQMAIERQEAVAMALASSAFGPVTATVCRDFYERRRLNSRARAQHEAEVCRTWQRRIDGVMAQLEQERNRQAAGTSRMISSEGARC